MFNQNFLSFIALTLFFVTIRILIPAYKARKEREALDKVRSKEKESLEQAILDTVGPPLQEALETLRKVGVFNNCSKGTLSLPQEFWNMNGSCIALALKTLSAGNDWAINNAYKIVAEVIIENLGSNPRKMAHVCFEIARFDHSMAEVLSNYVLWVGTWYQN